MDHNRTLSVLTAVLVLVTGGAARADAAAGPPGSVVPQEDPFYEPPTTPPGAPGTLIRSRPFTAYESIVVNLGKLVPVPARGRQIVYTSRASYALANGTEHESLLLTPLLAAGHAVVVPDFQGMACPAGRPT